MSSFTSFLWNALTENILALRMKILHTFGLIGTNSPRLFRKRKTSVSLGFVLKRKPDLLTRKRRPLY